jgi:NTP pyrophosphatase (non-canonical NTP hydrolase)
MTDNTQAKALEVFGADRQVDKCIEELGELATVLVKYRHGEASAADVIDELADVYITTGTIAMLFDRDAVKEQVSAKLSRLSRLVDDQVASKAQENPFRELVKEPKPGETRCGDCMWWGAQGRRDRVGVCMHQSRASRDRGYMAGADCSLAKPEPKPEKPATCWTPWQRGYNLHSNGRWLGFAYLANTMWVADYGNGDAKWFGTEAEAMRAIEQFRGLPEVPVWKP